MPRLVSGAQRFGDTTNFAEITAAGAISLGGTAKILHHAQIPFSAIVSGTANSTYGDVIGGPLLNANADILYGTVEVYPSWDGANVTFEIDWVPKTNIANGETVIFQWTWRSVAEGENVDTAHSATPATYTATYTSSGTTTAGKVIHTPCTMAYDNANQPLALGDHIYVKVYRDATADSFAGDIIATAFEYVYYAIGLSGS